MPGTLAASVFNSIPSGWKNKEEMEVRSRDEEETIPGQGFLFLHGSFNRKWVFFKEDAG